MSSPVAERESETTCIQLKKPRYRNLCKLLREKQFTTCSFPTVDIKIINVITVFVIDIT